MNTHKIVKIKIIFFKGEYRLGPGLLEATLPFDNSMVTFDVIFFQTLNLFFYLKLL